MKKNSFAPLTHSQVRILILGSLPGDRSLLEGQYYAHPQNLFWKIIALVTQSSYPESYAEKIKLLENNQIALWDVVKTANRMGSLDSSIKEVIPNNLPQFIQLHKNLQVIAFNGKKAEHLFKKYFDALPHIRYISLPSTSPANRTLSFENILERWRVLATL